MAQLSSAGWILVAASAVVAATGCDDGGGSAATNQLVSAPSAAVAVRVSQPQLQLAPVPIASCPMTQPFAAHFDLQVGPSSADFSVDDVTLRFVDGNGFSPFIFTKHDLDRLFGTTRVPSRTTRVFSLNPEFGCGLTSTPRSVVVVVTLVDGRGARHQATTSAPFGS